MSIFPKEFKVRNIIKLELDRERVERDGEYYYEDLVKYLDTNFADVGFVRDYSSDELTYFSDEPNNLLQQTACFARIAKEPAIFNYLTVWEISEYKNNDFINPVMLENALEIIASHGGKPLWDL